MLSLSGTASRRAIDEADARSRRSAIEAGGLHQFHAALPSRVVALAEGSHDAPIVILAPVAMAVRFRN